MRIWDYPAYVYAGGGRVYPIQVSFKRDNLIFTEPVINRQLFSFNKSNVRFFVDRNN